MEEHAARVAKLTGVEFEIYGFDSGVGLPRPTDYRDLPYHWTEGMFKMDREILERRLKRAKLVIGDVWETAATFTQTYSPAPIGCVMCDLDLYSSTKAAMKIFDEDNVRSSPRVPIYFDDIVGGPPEFYNDFTGQRLAIHEFNEEHEHSKISRCYLGDLARCFGWADKMFCYHNFAHREYGNFVSAKNQQLPL